MKILENRSWFILLNITFAGLLMLGLWQAAALPISLSGGLVLVFAMLGLERVVGKLLAVFHIKMMPTLGVVQ